MCIHSRTKDWRIAVGTLLLVGATFLSAQIVPAMAADMPPLDRVPIAPAFNWTGICCTRLCPQPP